MIHGEDDTTRLSRSRQTLLELIRCRQHSFSTQFNDEILCTSSYYSIPYALSDAEEFYVQRFGLQSPFGDHFLIRDFLFSAPFVNIDKFAKVTYHDRPILICEVHFKNLDRSDGKVFDSALKSSPLKSKTSYSFLFPHRKEHDGSSVTDTRRSYGKMVCTDFYP